MRAIRVRTNKFTMFYTADNDVVVTNLSDNTEPHCGKNSVVIVVRNVRVSFLTKEFYANILDSCVFFNYAQIINIKKTLSLTHCFSNSSPINFVTSLSGVKK